MARREDPHESVWHCLGELGELDKLGEQLQCLGGFHGADQANLCIFGLSVEAGRSRVILLTAEGVPPRKKRTVLRVCSMSPALHSHAPE